MKFTYRKALVLSLASMSLSLVNCSKASNEEASGMSTDNSASGAAAGAAGGALSSSNANGTQAQFKFSSGPSIIETVQAALNPLPRASADAYCPTFKTVGTGCTTSGGTMWLNYDSCSFKGDVSWTGTQAITMSTGTAACGTFPNPGANATLYRQFVQGVSSTAAGSASLTYNSKSATIDDESANLSNFDGDTLTPTNPNTGYGAAITFDSSGARSSIALGHHISVAGDFDHSVSGTLSISETAGATSRTITGSVKVYHNLMRVVGTSTFNDVLHNDVCCLPISGSITTVFSAGTNVSPTRVGLLAVGKTETLTFTGCGTASLESYDGSVVDVTLNRCF